MKQPFLFVQIEYEKIWARLKFILLINVKILGILTFMSSINYRLWWSQPEISMYFGYFVIYEQLKFYALLR